MTVCFYISVALYVYALIYNDRTMQVNSFNAIVVLGLLSIILNRR
jgi:hypothetical protein